MKEGNVILMFSKVVPFPNCSTNILNLLIQNANVDDSAVNTLDKWRPSPLRIK